jgi:hypothetical protein
MKKFIYYLPRGLAVLITALLYLFVLEGFDPEFGWQSGLMHFIIASIMLLFTIFAWKKPKSGGWIFLAMGVYYLAATSASGYWQMSLPLSIPMILSGILFLIEGFKKNKL